MSRAIKAALEDMGKSACPAFVSFEGSGGLGVDWSFFERNIYLVADDGQGLADGAGGKLEDRSGMHANGGQSPGLELFFNVDDYPFPVKVYGVDRETHGEGVDTVGGVNPQSLTLGEMGRVGGHEASKAGPMGARDQEIGREIGGAGAIESVSLGPARGHDDSSEIVIGDL
jgi:hypothetical protein